VLLLLLFVILPASGETVYAGKVTAITDGDTFHMRHNDREIKVRLSEIDTPDREKPYGSRAKQALSDMVLGKRVRVVAVGRSASGRILGRVYASGLDVNATMVKLGYAWVNRKDARDPELWRLEKEAKAGKRGLWALQEAYRTPPWEWQPVETQ
jgi:endonuclease YncB( thermonuclease family)